MSNELKMRVQKFGSSLSSCQFRWVQKKLKGGRGIVCMRYYPTGCHSDVGGVYARRAKLVGRSEKTRRGLGLAVLGWRGAS